MKKKSILFGILGATALAGIMARCACKVKVPGEAAEYADDSMITARVKAKLAADDVVKSLQVSVKTHNGNVQLSGFVDSQETINRAHEIVNSVEGVKSVRNDLVLKV